MKGRKQPGMLDGDGPRGCLRCADEPSRGPRLYTKEEILERAREIGREAARKSQEPPPEDRSDVAA